MKENIFKVLIVIFIAIIVWQFNTFIKIKKLDLKRELHINSSVDCFLIKNVEEMVDVIQARENCRKGIYAIEEKME